MSSLQQEQERMEKEHEKQKHFLPPLNIRKFNKAIKNNPTNEKNDPEISQSNKNTNNEHPTIIANTKTDLSEEELLNMIPIHPLDPRFQKRIQSMSNPFQLILHTPSQYYKIRIHNKPPWTHPKYTYYHGIKQYLFLNALLITFFLEELFNSQICLFLLTSAITKLVLEYFLEWSSKAQYQLKLTSLKDFENVKTLRISFILWNGVYLVVFWLNMMLFLKSSQTSKDTTGFAGYMLLIMACLNLILSLFRKLIYGNKKGMLILTPMVIFSKKIQKFIFYRQEIGPHSPFTMFKCWLWLSKSPKKFPF